MYRFRLENLLSVRRHERDAARQQYAQALEAQQLLVQRCADVEAELTDLKTLTRSGSSSGYVDVDRLLRAHRYELLLQVQRQQLLQQAARVAEEAERRRQALLQADREVRLLEKLKERQQAAYVAREWQREQKELDEIALHSRGRELESP